MRAGSAGVKALAPPVDLFEAFRRTRYRQRFLSHIRSSAGSMQALQRVIAESQEHDVYLMCMCPYRTAGDACHSYLLLDLARELDPTVTILPEPRPKRR